MTCDSYVSAVAREFGLTKSRLIEIILQGALDVQTRYFKDESKPPELEVVLNKDRLRKNIETLMREIQGNKTGNLFPLR
jgi:hypothetical protein